MAQRVKKRIIVTGGLGFIGSYFVELLLERGYAVTNIDKITYAARRDLTFDTHPDYELIREDIATLRHLPKNAEYIVNFAAESHVDNAITANGLFFESNTRGVYNLLELIRAKESADQPTLIHISTDEVYGEIPDGRSAKETDPLHPENPYAAAKAAAEMLIGGWVKTYGLKARICRSSNNYGFGQYPEKLMAKTVLYTTQNKKMTVHGDGSYKREWTFARDNAQGILLCMAKGVNGGIYNISSGEMFTNLQIVKIILKAMGKPETFFEFVENRLGQDIRYSVDSTKIRKLGWKPETTLVTYIPEYLKRTEHAHHGK